MMPRAEETGAALVNVLVLVMLLGVLAAGEFDRLRLAGHLQAGISARTAAQDVAQAGEALALAALARSPPGPGRTALLGRPQVFVLGDGQARVTLLAADGCFNLNSTVSGSGGTYAASAAGVAQLAQLLALAGTPAPDAARIAAATADFIDSDNQPLPGGAEDAAYARADPAYRTAGTLLADVSEWRAVAGVTPALFARMAPLLCAWPQTGPARIDLNALPPDAAPLLALLTGLPAATARQYLARRPAQGWAGAADVLALLPLGGRMLPPASNQQLAFASEHVQIVVEARAGQQGWRQTSLVQLARGGPQLLIRQGEAP
jgi:general secretion pathway protein K